MSVDRSKLRKKTIITATAMLILSAVVRVAVPLGPPMASAGMITQGVQDGHDGTEPIGEGDDLASIADHIAAQKRALLANTESSGWLTDFPLDQPIHDPFFPNRQSVAVKQPSADDVRTAARRLVLHAILPGSDGSACVINNLVLRVNQDVDGFTVDNIGDDRVIVHRGSDRFELILTH
jgi:hypothetical protein